MEIRVFFTLSELEELGEPAESLIIFDIFGASTMITASLTHGSLRIVPVSTVEEAIKLGKILGRDNVILCGEENGRRAAEFDMGNSPLEFDGMAVEGKVIIYLSEELSRIINSTVNTSKIMLGGFNNIKALSETVKETQPLHLLCAGKGENLSFEDAACAGMLVELLAKGNDEDKGLNDTAVTARYLYGRHAENIFGLLNESKRGQNLAKENRQRDLEYIATIDSTNVIAQLSVDRTHFHLIDKADNPRGNSR
jgi:2-phosphosulfolactate phosphatase